jgi:hypothetical protein
MKKGHNLSGSVSIFPVVSGFLESHLMSLERMSGKVSKCTVLARHQRAQAFRSACIRRVDRQRLLEGLDGVLVVA